MFQFPRFPTTSLCVQLRLLLVRNSGFPHSEISGSKPVHGSPKLIAVTHVLHRHLTPRHPPYALSSFHVMRRIRYFFLHHIYKISIRMKCNSKLAYIITIQLLMYWYYQPVVRLRVSLICDQKHSETSYNLFHFETNRPGICRACFQSGICLQLYWIESLLTKFSFILLR